MKPTLIIALLPRVRAMKNELAWPLGSKLHLLSGKGVPQWFHSFAGYIVAIGHKRYRVSVPVDDDRERWIPASQLQLDDPWRVR